MATPSVGVKNPKHFVNHHIFRRECDTRSYLSWVRYQKNCREKCSRKFLARNSPRQTQEHRQASEPGPTRCNVTKGKRSWRFFGSGSTTCDERAGSHKV